MVFLGGCCYWIWLRLTCCVFVRYNPCLRWQSYTLFRHELISFLVTRSRVLSVRSFLDRSIALLVRRIKLRTFYWMTILLACFRLLLRFTFIWLNCLVCSNKKFGRATFSWFLFGSQVCVLLDARLLLFDCGLRTVLLLFDAFSRAGYLGFVPRDFLAAVTKQKIAGAQVAILRALHTLDCDGLVRLLVF